MYAPLRCCCRAPSVAGTGLLLPGTLPPTAINGESLTACMALCMYVGVCYRYDRKALSCCEFILAGCEYYLWKILSLATSSFDKLSGLIVTAICPYNE